MRIPKHIAIIPDGNRRWAENSGLGKHEGYHHGLDPGLQVLHLAQEAGVQELTYYGFTVDNCKRPAVQVKAFRQACVNAVEQILGEDVALLVLGNTTSDQFPKELLPYSKKRVAIGTGRTRVNFLVNYSWEWDLGQAAPCDCKRSSLLDALASHEVSRIDLVIRWGGRRRLSGLLPIQAVYSDFYVRDEFWPEFKPQHFADALQWYDQQDVTLGG